MTARLALLGHPVAHTRSPAMMSAAIAAAGLDARYDALDVPPDALADTVASLWRGGALGANVTTPHKVAMRAHLAGLDASAREVGAVNTLARGADGFVGVNTDVAGFVDALGAGGVALTRARVVVLGRGGAARAAAVGARDAGASHVVMVSRAWRDDAPPRDVAAVTLGDAACVEAMARADVVVQATPCGMQGGPDPRPWLDGAPLSRCPPHAWAMDLVYAPRETEWMTRAASCGLRVVPDGGLAMLAAQGAAAFARWFDVAPPTAVMRRALGL